MAKAFAGKTLELAEKSKVSKIEKFVDWFIDNGLDDYSDVAVAGTSEDGFENSIIEAMVGEGIVEAKKRAIKSPWKSAGSHAATNTTTAARRDRTIAR